MTTPMNPSTRRSLVAGLALIAFGALMLLGQLQLLSGAEMLVLPALAVIFLAWGLATRTFGLLIPGGVLAGIGAGSYLIARPLADVAEPTQGAIFLLAFGAGWLLIALLSPLATSGFQWWPLIPAGVIGGLGALLLAGDAGLQVLRLLGYAWPLALIAVGAWILLRRRA
ncbi:MAG: hypothetical protein ACP5UQ_06840 [Anaerolineae bacterium]